MSTSKTHWVDVYDNKDETRVSWYTPRPQVSLDLIARATLPPRATILDVGAGTSRLVDHLLDAGYANITLLDIAAPALEQTRARLERAGRAARFLVGDVLTVPLNGPYTLWHDRAVFHFLTDPGARATYLERVRDHVAADGWLVIGTFAEDGPTRCSGLDVQRYSPEQLEKAFADRFDAVELRRDVHHTPGGSAQAFTYGLFRRR